MFICLKKELHSNKMNRLYRIRIPRKVSLNQPVTGKQCRPDQMSQSVASDMVNTVCIKYRNFYKIYRKLIRLPAVENRLVQRVAVEVFAWCKWVKSAFTIHVLSNLDVKDKNLTRDQYRNESQYNAHASTHLRQVDASSIIIWTGLFPIAGCLISFY